MKHNHPLDVEFAKHYRKNLRLSEEEQEYANIMLSVKPDTASMRDEIVGKCISNLCHL